MALTPPSAAQEALERTLAWAFGRAGADWAASRPDLPPSPNLCPSAGAKPPVPAPRDGASSPIGDRWLPMEFPNLVLDLARRLRLDDVGQRALEVALRAAKLETLPVARTLRVLTGGDVKTRPVERTEACPLITAYLEPLLDPRAYGSWLNVMADENWLVSSGGAKRGVPLRVVQQERDRDREIAERWAGAPPVSGSASQLTEFDRRLRRLAAFQHAQRPGVPKEGVLPVVVLGTTLAPANLYISEAAPTLAGYLGLLSVVLEWGDRGLRMAPGLMAVAYGLLALVSVPINCLYDAFHGTCTVEVLLPRLLVSTATWAGFALGGLKRLARERLRLELRSEEDRDATVLLDAFVSWSEGLSTAFQKALLTLLRTAAEQGGGRVRTPIQLTESREWRFTINERNDDGTLRAVERSADEALDRDTPASPEEIFWMLPNLWVPFGTGVALANQSGVRVWINAANNRWGGRHPPHSDHRQGATFDLDVGLAWRSNKVRNVLKRDEDGFPIPERAAPANREGVGCLRFMERIAGWILTQAFVLVGVKYYLYGDASLVELASGHVAAQLQVEPPARVAGRVEAGEHFNHWHFEMLVGPRPGGSEAYVWQVADPSLLDRLRDLAVARDQDPLFWERFAGIHAVPTQPSDFDGIQDAEDWKRWWNRRNEPAGIPLLPIWSPSEAVRRVFSAKGCGEGTQPPGDYPDAFPPGTART